MKENMNSNNIGRATFLKDKKIALALSGGGMRAILFHLGVLRFLAENNLLENVSYISSVSGGSLLTGLIFSVSRYKWPASREFLGEVYPKVKEIILEKSLQRNSFNRFILHLGFLSMNKCLRASLRYCWGISGTINNLPKTPTWAINCSTQETGNRWRIKGDTMGDYEIGYTNADNLFISDAITISASFPGFIGSYKIRVKDHKWFDYKTHEETKIKYIKIHLLDGGLYDNLGLEPVFDSQEQKIKNNSNIDYIILSDAGYPFARKNPSIWIKFFSRSMRIVDIIYENVRKLRSRVFAGMISKNRNGMILKLGLTKKDISNRVAPSIQKSWRGGPYAKDSELTMKEIRGYPTDLKKPTKTGFVLIEEHGHETAKFNFEILSTETK
jgi:NTE family protein